MLFDRVLQLKLTDKKSAFLWGARQTGKSTYLKEKFAESIRYDLLKTDLRLRLENKPYLFRERSWQIIQNNHIPLSLMKYKKSLHYWMRFIG